MQEIFVFEKMGMTQDGKVIGPVPRHRRAAEVRRTAQGRGHPPAAGHVRRHDGGAVMRTLLPLVVFVVGAGSIAGGYALLAWLPARLAQRRIETRIAGWQPVASSRSDRSHVDPQAPDDGALPGLDKLAGQMRWGSSLADMIRQSGSRHRRQHPRCDVARDRTRRRPDHGFLTRMPWAMPAAGLAGASVPILVIMQKRTKRMRTIRRAVPRSARPAVAGDSRRTRVHDRHGHGR